MVRLIEEFCFCVMLFIDIYALLCFWVITIQLKILAKSFLQTSLMHRSRKSLLFLQHFWNGNYMKKFGLCGEQKVGSFSCLVSSASSLNYLAKRFPFDSFEIGSLLQNLACHPIFSLEHASSSLFFLLFLLVIAQICFPCQRIMWRVTGDWVRNWKSWLVVFLLVSNSKSLLLLSHRDLHSQPVVQGQFALRVSLLKISGQANLKSSYSTSSSNFLIKFLSCDCTRSRPTLVSFYSSSLLMPFALLRCQCMDLH